MFEILDKFHNLSMKSREGRLKTAKQETSRTVRELKKDRLVLERTEKDIMKHLRLQLKSGDLPKAQILGRQIAQYRNLSDKNFERAVYLQTEAQIRASNHKINQAHVEFLKIMNFANGAESIEQVKIREKKYHVRQDIQLTVENLVNEGFDEIFNEQDSERKDPYWIDSEITQIIREAIDSKQKTRDYGIPNTDSMKKFINHVRLFARNYEEGAKSKVVSFCVPNLEISVDMLKRQLQKDASVIRQLGLYEAFTLANLQIGDVVSDGTDKGLFGAFENSQSLKANGVKEGTVLYMLVRK